MNKLNKQRQQMYLDGKVGLINDGTVEQFKEVAIGKGWDGNAKYYHGRYANDIPQDGIDYKPMSWFYEDETELPKVVRVRIDKCTSNYAWYYNNIGNEYYVQEYDADQNYWQLIKDPIRLILKSDCTIITDTTTAPDQQPTSWKLNVDVPEWNLEKGTIGTQGENYVEFERSVTSSALIPISIIQHIATPIYSTPFTLENGSEIQLSSKDIENIKKLN